MKKVRSYTTSDVLAIIADRAMKSAEIAETLGVSPASVRAVMSGLSRRGAVVAVAGNRWQAAQTWADDGDNLIVKLIQRARACGHWACLAVQVGIRP